MRKHVAILFTLGTLSSSEAGACGASATSGGVSVCSLKDIREKERKKFHVGAGYGFADTTIRFSEEGGTNEFDVDQTRHAAMAVFEWRATPRWNFQVGAGALLSGQLSLESTGENAEMNPGFVPMLGASFLALAPKGGIPFLLLSSQISAVFASTDTTSENENYTATDLRFGAAVGWNLFRMVSPYALARAFGGPVLWTVENESVVGSDLYKYQVGGGLSLLLDYRFDFYVEGVALGERGLSAGAGFAF